YRVAIRLLVYETYVREKANPENQRFSAQILRPIEYVLASVQLQRLAIQSLVSVPDGQPYLLLWDEVSTQSWRLSFFDLFARIPRHVLRRQEFRMLIEDKLDFAVVNWSTLCR